MSRVLAALLLAALVAAPLVLEGYWIGLLTLVLLFATVGQAWNLAMGYAGVLSLGHALFLGLGGYATALMAGELGIVPWIGIPLGGLLAAAFGAVIAWLGFRFAVKGVYFALLTIAFAEFFRIWFDNWSFVGASGGYFLPALAAEQSAIVNLRGSSVVLYYAFLGLSVLTLIACHLLVRSRWGFFWRAVREDEEAAAALGVGVARAKIAVVAVSAGITGIAGGLFALLNGSLFPDSIMGMRLSIEMIVAPIIGGLGTLAGPILGAFVIVPVMEIANEIGQEAGIFGFNTFVYGAMVFVIIVFRPGGIWPWIAGLSRRRGAPSGDAAAAPAAKDARDA